MNQLLVILVYLLVGYVGAIAYLKFSDARPESASWIVVTSAIIWPVYVVGFCIYAPFWLTSRLLKSLGIRSYPEDYSNYW